jgi:hypothetical protein
MAWHEDLGAQLLESFNRRLNLSWFRIREVISTNDSVQRRAITERDGMLGSIDSASMATAREHDNALPCHQNQRVLL